LAPPFRTVHEEKPSAKNVAGQPLPGPGAASIDETLSFPQIPGQDSAILTAEHLAIPALQFNRCLLVEPQTSANWGASLIRIIAGRLAAQGVECDVFRFGHPVKSEEAFELITLISQKGKYDFVFNLNRIPANHVKLTDPPGQTFYGLSSAPVVTWLIDNIAYHASSLVNDPVLENETLQVIDAASIEGGRTLGVQLGEDAFLPAWGLPRQDNLPPMEERDIPLLFSGYLGAEEPLNDMLDRVAAGNMVLRKAVRDTVDQMMGERGRTDPFQAMIKNFLRLGLPEIPSDVFEAMDRWLRFWARRRLLRSFEKSPLVVFGNVQDAVLEQRENVKLRGQVPVEEVALSVQRARVLLGDCVFFTRGVDLRPAFTITNGCVLADEGNPYLRETLGGGAMIELDVGDGPSDCQIADVLESPERLAAISDKADAVYDRLVQAPLPFLERLTHAP